MKNTTLRFSVTQDGKQFPLEGLLVDFIKTHAESYVEPSRKGAARGEQIGMKTKKYLATLLALTSYRIKDQANLLKIPEKLLGKWRTERPFQEQVIGHMYEFDEKIFCPHVKRHWEKEFERLTEARDLPIAEYAEFVSNYTPEPYEHFGDRSLYGENLISTLGEFVGDVIDEKKQVDLFLHTRVAIWRMKRSFRGLPPDRAKEKARQEKNQPEIIDAIKSILVKDDITDDDRKRAIVLLEWLMPE